MATTFHNLQDLMTEQLGDLYDAEQRLVKALPKMAEAAAEPKLRQAFLTHLAETEGQVKRLEQVFAAFKLEPEAVTCEAMKGLLEEGQEAIKAKGNPAVKDAALIAAAQRVEHYEIAGYGTLRTIAHQLGNDKAAKLLQQTLDEEGNTDKLLTKLAEGMVYEQTPA